jgi:hypothetical protein
VLAFESGFPFQAKLITQLRQNERHHTSSRPSERRGSDRREPIIFFFLSFFSSFLLLLCGMDNAHDDSRARMAFLLKLRVTYTFEIPRSLLRVVAKRMKTTVDSHMPVDT